VIYECVQDLQAKLTAQAFPTLLEYGPRRLAVEAWHDHLVIVERDRENADLLAPVNGQQTNPRRYCNRRQAVKFTIYARSNLDSARVNEHEAECEQIVDALIVAIAEWGTEARARLGSVDPTITEARYLKLAEFPEQEAWPGVVYVIRLRIDRGVYKKTYEGAARPTGHASHVGGELEVRRNAGDAPEYVPPRP
jgi:hypothetical protein